MLNPFILRRLVALFCIFYSFSLFATPAEVLIIRHGEKPMVGNQLNTRGEERAHALAPYILDGYGTPVAIFAQRANDDDHSVRSIQTVTPLADEKKMIINTDYTHREYPAMVEEIKSNPKYTGKTVLICWEHHVIPKIAAALGVHPEPQKWPGEVFDRVWVITYQADGTVSFKDIPQRLLFGDAIH